LKQLLDVYVDDPDSETISILRSFVARYKLQLYNMNVEDNSLLDAVVDQLHQLGIITDSQQLRTEIIEYLDKNRCFDDDTPVMDDEEWQEFKEEPCGPWMLMALAEILQRQIYLYSAAAENTDHPLILVPHNQTEAVPIHVGHTSGSDFVTLREIKSSDVLSRAVLPSRKHLPGPSAQQLHQSKKWESDSEDGDLENLRHLTGGELNSWNVGKCFLLQLGALCFYIM
jgi:hypothetical protein